MPLDFSFATASQIIFGNNSIEKVPGLISKLGKKVLLVCGKNKERTENLIRQISSGIEIYVFNIPGEPTTDLIKDGLNFARQNSCDMVVGFGGGSVIDSAKAIAALVPNQGDLMDYLEVIGLGKPLLESPLPCIAIPTTAGTGAEVTRNSVIKSLEYNVKVSLRNDLMYPNFAVVDPVLTYSMSRGLTASTGVDALTHLLETFVSNQANPFNDMLCREGLKRISRSLIMVCRDGKDEYAREDMAMASLLGGMALANVKLGAIHGFAGPMGGMFPIPHGAVCAGLLAAVIEVNMSALKGQNKDISKFDELARIVCNDEKALAEDAVTWAKNLVIELQIPSLSKFGIGHRDYPELIINAKNASSMQGNPIVLNDGQLQMILEKSM